MKQDIDFAMGMERESIPIYWDGERNKSPVGYQNTIVGYYIIIYGVKIYISEEKYKDIIENMKRRNKKEI